MQSIIVKTLAGLEPVLAEELRLLGAKGIRPLKRAVGCEGDMELVYRANYELRTALRVLLPIRSFSAYNERSYYDALRDINWTKFMGVNDSLAVDAVTQGEVFRHSHYLGLLTKDAIVDQFRDRYNRRPNVNTIAPNLRVNVHVQGTHVDISLDSSGDSLHKRNYRRDTVEAPLNEVLAAGMILLSGWNGKGPFVDPMCGSGTLPIEATLIATQTPVQFKRGSFGFFKWPDFDAKRWNALKSAADARIQPFEFPILASDKESRARNATSLNLMSAGLEKWVRVEKMPFDKLEAPEVPGTLIMNPPYDERLKVEDTLAFYKSIGDVLKKRWTGWNAWVISSNRDALKHVGLRTSKRLSLFNGALECGYHQFEMF